MRTGRRRGRLLDAVAVTAISALLAAALSGCVSLAVSAGATVGTAAAEERGLTGAANDLAVEAAVNGVWLEHAAGLVGDLDVTVYEGRALLTGTVPSPERRLQAVRLARRAAGVKAVIDEIEVGRAGGVTGYSRDGWITAQLVSRLTFDFEVEAINYTVETANRVVYLMGIAQDQAELDRVTNHARQVPYVRRVVSHVRLKGRPAHGAARGP